MISKSLASAASMFVAVVFSYSGLAFAQGHNGRDRISTSTVHYPYTYCVLIDDRHRSVYLSNIYTRRTLSTNSADDFSIAVAKRFPVLIGTGKCYDSPDTITAQREQLSTRSQWEYVYRIIDTGWNPDVKEIDPSRLLPQIAH